LKNNFTCQQVLTVYH